MKNQKALFALLALMVVVSAALFPILPLVDPAEYFNFADGRELLGIPNIGDVLSNLPLLLVGIYYLWVLRSAKPHPLRPYAVILAWVSVFTFLGSAYFHWSPTPESLFWDRLPMSVGFASIVGLIIADRLNSRWGWKVTLGLTPLSVFTVFGYSMQWLSLRPYLILQFGSLLFVLLVSLLQRRGAIRNPPLWMGFVLYGSAKVFEVLDHQIFNTTMFVSGHTLKHLFAASSVFMLLKFAQTKKS